LKTASIIDLSLLAIPAGFPCQYPRVAGEIRRITTEIASFHNGTGAFILKA